MTNISKKKSSAEEAYELSKSAKNEVFNQTYSIRNARKSKEMKENNRIFRRYSIDDNGGGYTGL